MATLSPITTKKLNGFMAAGLAEHLEFVAGFNRMKANALRAGVYFMKAKAEIAPGEWMDYVATFAQRINERTIRRYMEFADKALAAVAELHPGKTGDALLQAALDMALQSPKELVALCRQVDLMRRFGEYDAVKYHQKKLGNGGGGQTEFAFTAALPTLAMLAKIGSPDFKFVFPEDQDQAECIDQLEESLETALARVRALKRSGRIVDVEGSEPETETDPE